MTDIYIAFYEWKNQNLCIVILPTNFMILYFVCVCVCVCVDGVTVQKG